MLCDNVASRRAIWLFLWARTPIRAVLAVTEAPLFGEPSTAPGLAAEAAALSRADLLFYRGGITSRLTGFGLGRRAGFSVRWVRVRRPQPVVRDCMPCGSGRIPQQTRIERLGRQHRQD